MKNYSLHDTFLLRTPSLAFDNELKKIMTKPKSMQIKALKLVFSQFDIQEAIFIASPILYEQLLKWLRNDLSIHEELAIAFSLMKYLARMSTRCTPFGLFAGCTIGEWGNSNSIKLNASPYHISNTRLDMDYLGNLVEYLSSLKDIQDYILFFPNNSLYDFENKLRYIDYHFKEKQRVHKIVEIDKSEYVECVIKKSNNGTKIADLVRELIDMDIPPEEAYSFIQEMIHEKVLVSELDCVTTGKDMLLRTINILAKIESQSKVAFDNTLILCEIKTLLTKIDSNIIGSSFSLYNTLEEKLKQLPFPSERSRFFQTDMLKTSQSCTINKQLAGTIRRALEVLNRLTFKHKNTNLDKFKEAFISRYDKREMPLATVLDVDIGVGFRQNDRDKKGFNPFIDDFNLPILNNTELTLEWNKHQSFLLKKLIDAQKKNIQEVTILDDEILSFNSDWSDLPDSLSVIGSILSHEDNQKYPKFFIKSVNSGATHLLGRFTHLDNKINEWVCEITRQEQELLPNDTLYAEIVHLPESRTGNVLMRTNIRAYEIPYLAQSSVVEDKQIPISDLMVSVKNGEVVLRSKRLNKRILPTMGNAHNYTYKALPVYEFLCNLQYQNCKVGLGFNWGALANEFKFLPRVLYHNVILFQATWQLAKNDFLDIINISDDFLLKGVSKWRAKWKIPQRILLIEGDNELFIDLKCHLSVKVFIKEIKQKSSIVLKEFDFIEKNNFVNDTEGYNYTNQLICVFNKKNNESSRQVNPKTTIEEFALARTFPIGSNWLYYQIYCGVSIGDEILREKIREIAFHLTKSKMIGDWFFIRYADPKPHIRLRFSVLNKSNLGNIINIIYNSLQYQLDNQFISSIQTDTYEREIERYGDKTMELSENIFRIDSETTLNFLMFNETLLHDNRWLYGLFCIDALLNAFDYKIEDKIRVLNSLQHNFGREFNINDSVRKTLNKKLENYDKEIKSFFNKANLEDTIAQLNEFVCEKEDTMKPVAKKIKEIVSNDFNKLDSLVSDYIHMLQNRLFISEQRTHEFILYYFLYNTYKSINLVKY